MHFIKIYSSRSDEFLNVIRIYFNSDKCSILLRSFIGQKF